MKCPCLALLLIFTATSVSAQPPESARSHSLEPSDKPPWEWTVEERFERLKAWNVERHRLEGLRVGETTEQERARLSGLDGKEHPELYFAFELFEHLVGTALGPPESSWAWREGYAEQVALYLGPPEEVWAKLETAARELVWMRQKAFKIGEGYLEADEEGRQQIRAEMAAAQESLCQVRHESLENARALLGRKALDRYLYEVIAPQVRTFFVDEMDDDLAQLRGFVEGCP